MPGERIPIGYQVALAGAVSLCAVEFFGKQTDLLPVFLLAVLTAGTLHIHFKEGGVVSKTLRRFCLSSNARTAFYIGLYIFFAICFVSVTGGPGSAYLGVFIIPILVAAVRSGLATSLYTSFGISGFCMIFLFLSRKWNDTEARALIQGNIVLFNIVALFAGILVDRVGVATRLLENRASEAIALHDLSQMVDSANDLETTLNLVTILLRGLFSHANACAIFLADPSGKHLELKAWSGIDIDESQVIPLFLDEEEHGWAPAGGVPLLIHDAAHYSYSSLNRYFPCSGSYLLVPLRSIEGVIGLIAIAGRRAGAFTDLELHQAELFSSRVAFPIQRAKLQQELQWMAFTDGLTGLYNHRFFQEQLHEELEKSKRYQHAVSLIILDIDYFKQYNDTYGHQAGDLVLKQVASLIQREIRHADIAARYGGEEFVIICPETAESSAVSLAERLLAAVRQEGFRPSPDQIIPLTISAGVSTFPIDGKTRDELIRSADKALYEAKHSGRNAARTARESGIEQILD